MSTPNAAAQSGPPDGHPAKQFIHQPEKPPPFVPNELHVRLFEALAELKDTTMGQTTSLPIRGGGAALFIAFMVEDLGEKKLAKMSAKDLNEWVLTFRRQSPRLWSAFQLGHVVQLFQQLSLDRNRPAKSVGDWQREQFEIARSEPKE